MSGEQTVDSSDAVPTLRAHVAAIDSGSRLRGRAYHLAGRVTALVRMGDDTIDADVRGSRSYRVVLRREAGEWQNDCSCPLGGDCKHVVAAAMAWLEGLSRSPLPDLSRGLPWPLGTIEAPSARQPGSFRAKWEPILAGKLKRPLTTDEGAFLGKLSQIFHNFRQSGRVGSSDLVRLGFSTRESRLGPFEKAFDGWWEKPPRDPMELWQYMAHDIELSGLLVPDFLRPVTDTAKVATRLQELMRRESVKRWNERFDRFLANARSLPAVAGGGAQAELVELRLCLGASKWTIEIRPRPDAPWKPASRGFLDRCVRATAGEHALLDAAPAAQAFLAVCREHYRRTYSIPLGGGSHGSRELLHRLLSDRLARTLVAGAGGKDIQFSEAPLAWRLERSRGNERDYEIALCLPDGGPLPASAMHLPGRPDLYLHEGTVFQGPPALDGDSVAAAIVPAEVVERPEVLRTLKKLGTRMPAEIEERFVTVPMRARIECALAFDWTQNEILTLELLAVADDPAGRQAWTPGGWSAIAQGPAKAPPDGKAKVISFDTAAADRVTGRLDELGLAFDFTQKRWIRRATKNFAEDFVAWREALPPDVEVLATGELASLLGGPIRAHVEFELIETTVHRDWFDLALALRPEDSTLTPAEIALLLKARGRLVRLPGKGWRRLSVQLEGAPVEALASAGLDVETLAVAAVAGERHRFHALQLAQTTIADCLPERQAAALQARARELTIPEPPALPKGLLAEMRPYQCDGFRFLAFLSANRLGGVLADDMGLGKTVQALAWLLWLAERKPAGKPLRTLVVCPKSVAGNWEAETAKFTPAIGVLRFTPALAAAGKLPREKRPLIVVANYTQLRLNDAFFQAQAWDAVVLDEGQFIKTPGSKVAQVARALPGEHRLVLTGTPIENRLLDLWSLFAFALPGLLGTQAAFKRQYAADNPLALARLRARVRHFMLRRTKGQVASDLPARTEEDVTVDLEGEQARLYQAELKRARAALLKVETPRELDRARFHILASLMKLRQICCHPALVDPAHRDAPSAKLEELMERLTELRDEGHQVLVFSQFVEMLEIIRGRLEVAGIGHLMLTGKTENREALVAKFQSDRSSTVFLLSLKAAGFGLNLTAASYVILYDPWWNPAVEAQAIDRTHRIGQSAPVNAYRLIASGTVEEKIRLLQREKASLAGAIMQEESLAAVLDLDTLRQVLA